jgi:hypothetical protein
LLYIEKILGKEGVKHLLNSYPSYDNEKTLQELLKKYRLKEYVFFKSRFRDYEKDVDLYNVLNLYFSGYGLNYKKINNMCDYEYLNYLSPLSSFLCNFVLNKHYEKHLDIKFKVLKKLLG